MTRHTGAERFAQYVDANGPISLVRGVQGRCHIWTGGSHSKRDHDRGEFGEFYGTFYSETRKLRAHRFAYEQDHGEIPPTTFDADGTEQRAVVDHRCRRRNCVNVAHLELVPERTNILRGTAPSAHHASKTHCDNGHDLTDPANLYARAGRPEWRKCRTCQLDRDRARMADPERSARKREHDRQRYARKRAQQATTVTPNPQRSAA